jgi:hypothetical protein
MNNKYLNKKYIKQEPVDEAQPSSPLAPYSAPFGGNPPQGPPPSSK